jgi:hypothetical protein
MNVTDELQVSVYLTLTGFYRQAIGTLRAALEGMLAALYFSVVSDQAAIDEWLAGTDEGRVWVRKVRLKLRGLEPFAQFEQQVNWPLFADGGWFAWLYKTLSAFVHGRPAHTDKSGHRMETQMVACGKVTARFTTTGRLSSGHDFTSILCCYRHYWQVSLILS